jgi:hypothetical protein
LGFLLVTYVPNLTQQRQYLLPMAARSLGLPDLHQQELPEMFYSAGWSHGREQLNNGVPDYNKNSIYANPQVDNLSQAL